MSFIVVIPARFASERLPGKPLLDIAGKAMIARVYECAIKSNATRVVVATDDSRIERAVRDIGAEVVMTSSAHPSGTDRLQEVAAKLQLGNDDIVVNVQGDEPLIPPQVINQVAQNLERNHQASAATLSEPVCDIGQAFNSNTVKVVSDEQGFALYFSRAPIPWVRGSFDGDTPKLPHDNLLQRHIGIYAYRARLLHQFVKWPAAALEKYERLEQLRILANGHKIHVAQSCVTVPGGVDTQEDLEAVRAFVTDLNSRSSS